mmetsp:Transcript_33558/g.80025  ORF Transcript_33558/g.80025 Transcript_33558/m.80025 type:complete len:250 (-) Transcript_33558:64-813(-)
MISCDAPSRLFTSDPLCAWTISLSCAFSSFDKPADRKTRGRVSRPALSTAFSIRKKSSTCFPASFLFSSTPSIASSFHPISILYLNVHSMIRQSPPFGSKELKSFAGSFVIRFLSSSDALAPNKSSEACCKTAATRARYLFCSAADFCLRYCGSISFSHSLTGSNFWICHGCSYSLNCLLKGPPWCFAAKAILGRLPLGQLLPSSHTLPLPLLAQALAGKFAKMLVITSSSLRRKRDCADTEVTPAHTI